MILPVLKLLDIGTKLVDAAGVYASFQSNKLTKEANKLAEVANHIALIEKEPVLFFNAVKVASELPAEDITSRVFFDLDAYLDKAYPEYDVLVLNLENKGNCIINNIKCKRLIVFSGSYYDLDQAGEAEGWEFTASDDNDMKQKVKMPQDTSTDILILAGNDDTLTDFIRNHDISTIQVQFEVETTFGLKYECCLSCCIENITSDGYGQYNIIKQE